MATTVQNLFLNQIPFIICTHQRNKAFDVYFIGDIVGLGWLSGDVKEIASGIVSRVTETAVTVAFEETADSLTFDDDGPFKLVKLANDVTHKRIKRFVIMGINIFYENTINFTFSKCIPANSHTLGRSLMCADQNLRSHANLFLQTNFSSLGEK